MCAAIFERTDPMMLKRQFEPASLQAFLVAKMLGATHPPEALVTHHTVENTGLGRQQNFDDQWVEQGVAAGWATLSGDRLELKTDGEPLRYTILRGPGYYCKSTGEPIPMHVAAWLKFRLANDSSQSRPIVLAWLAANGKNATDYEILAQFNCLLDEDQHNHWRAVRHPVNGNIVPAHQLQKGA
jgi:hypothetical protein